MRDRFTAVTQSLLDENPRVSVVIAEISSAQFHDAEVAHPGRVINIGIREELMLGVTGGLALAGLRPIAHSYAAFLIERAWEAIKLDLTHQDVGAVLVSIGASYDASLEGRTHQSPGDVALLDTLPGWTVHVPGHPAEVEPLLRSAVGGHGRCYIRLSAEENTDAAAGEVGRIQVVRRGDRATVVAVGPTLSSTLDAVRGLDVTVLYVTTVRPFDAETFLAAAGEDVILVEPYLAGTSAPLLTRLLAHRPHRLLCLGIEELELRRYGSRADHRRAHGLDPDGLRARIGRFLQKIEPSTASGSEARIG
jgi:transketolase